MDKVFSAYFFCDIYRHHREVRDVHPIGLRLSTRSCLPFLLEEDLNAFSPKPRGRLGTHPFRVVPSVSHMAVLPNGICITNRSHSERVLRYLGGDSARPTPSGNEKPDKFSNLRTRLKTPNCITSRSKRIFLTSLRCCAKKKVNSDAEELLTLSTSPSTRNFKADHFV